MNDLDDLHVFERVATLKSFSSAALALSRPRSTVSRCIARLEETLGTRLLQRTTRDVTLTPAGEAMLARCSGALNELSEALDYVGSLAKTPRGRLRISCGIGWAYNVLADQLPNFVKAYPEIDLQVDVTSRVADLVQERVDVAIRIGPIPDSSIVTVKLGSMTGLLCAAPRYLDARGTPTAIDDLKAHDFIAMPSPDGRPRVVVFTNAGQTSEITLRPRIEVNEALTIHRMVKGGAGIGFVAKYLSGPDIAEGTLVNLLPKWSTPVVDVSLVFPSKKELAPAVRAFLDFMKAENGPGVVWSDRPGEPARRPTRRA